MDLRFRDVLRTEATPLSKAGTIFASVLCIFAILFLTFFLTSCGGDDSSSSPVTASGVDTTSTTAETNEMSPEELGDAIGETWGRAMQELVALLEGQPDAATVQGQVEQLKETYIGELVSLGRMKEGLPDSDKAKVTSRTQTALNAAADEPWFVSYMDIYEAYPLDNEDDLDFKNLLASFNILTQYADFDLLKQQAPEEAARLGIE